MAVDFMILDTRVADDVDGFNNDNVFVCDDSVPVSRIVAEVQKLVKRRGQRVKRLIIYGHGLEMQVYDDKIHHQCVSSGGYGVELGKDNLILANVAEFAPLARDFFSGGGIIEFRSCAIARRAPDLPEDAEGKKTMLSGNGRTFLLELAAHANVKVKASDAVQYAVLRVNHKDDKFLGFPLGMRIMEYAENNWYGNVYIFDPVTQSGKRVPA
jgi:hypothetical protein